MASLEDLKEELRREKNYYESQKEIEALGREKAQISKELKAYKFQNKHPVISKVVQGTKGFLDESTKKIAKAYQQPTKKSKRQGIDWNAYYKQGSLFG